MPLNFDLAHLRLFLAVAEEQNLTKGARRVFLSTSAASARIRELERQVRTQLFYRRLRGVELTGAGVRLVRHARLVLRQIDHLADELEIDGPDGSGHLRIFANTTAVTDVLPEVLARFMAERPRLTIDLLEKVTSEILTGVLEGAADLGIVAGPVRRDGLQTLQFSTDRVVLIAAHGHPLAERSEVCLDDVLEAQHIGLHEGSSLLSFVRGLAQERGKPLKVRIQVYSFEAVCRMVSAGVGIALLPESAARRHQPHMGFAVVALNEVWALRERSVVVRDFEALPNAGRALVQALQGAHRVQDSPADDVRGGFGVPRPARPAQAAD